MTRLKGSCYCGNIAVDVQLSKPAHEYSPRSCDCGFCTKHGAAYVSDSEGSLSFRVKEMKALGRFRQSRDGQAEFLHCTHCGVLVGVVFQEGETLFGAFNSSAVDGNIQFAQKVVVSPRLLSAADKAARWKEVWFKNVTLAPL